MMTLDTLLLDIVKATNPSLDERLPHRDVRILRSLATGINNNLFITENQSDLLLKIFQQNLPKLKEFSGELENLLRSPTWSQPFRYIEQIKRCFITNDDEGELCIGIDISHNAKLRKAILDISQGLSKFSTGADGKTFRTELTERNIVSLVDHLEKHSFSFDEKLMEYYHIIKSWNYDDIRAKFLIQNIENLNFQKHITEDLGTDKRLDRNIINDRSNRYLFFTDYPKNHGETLTEVIANRSKTRVWVDKSEHTLTEVVKSLKDLDRLPVLVVFDNMVDEKYLKNLEILSKSLEENDITDGVGIYFRLPNDEMGTEFNKFIAEKKYNSLLDKNLKVASVMSGKIPKFFLKNEWKPMSVITLDTTMGLRHGKTSVYANCCDLIVEWADAPVLYEGKNILK